MTTVDSNGLDAAKRDLRAQATARRRALAEQNRARAGFGLVSAFQCAFPDWTGAVAGYWPIGDEADVRPLLDWLCGQGNAIGLPVVVGKAQALLFRGWSVGDDLVVGPHGTRHPLDDRPVIIPDMVLTPLLAFDRQGGRLGYGGGYYDRTLAELRAGKPDLRVIGIAYTGQEVAEVPRGPHDETVDWVLTENGAVEMRAGR